MKLLFVIKVILVLLVACTDPNSKQMENTGNNKDISIAGSTEPEQTVIKFYDWYLGLKERGEMGIELQHSSPDSIIQIVPDTYFSKLAASGYIGEEYISKQRNHLTSCNEQLKQEKQTEGVPACLETDLVTGEQEQSKGFITRSASITGDNALVETSGYDVSATGDTVYCCSSKISLSRKENKWLITSIE